MIGPLAICLRWKASSRSGKDTVAPHLVVKIAVGAGGKVSAWAALLRLTGKTRQWTP